MPQFTKEQEKAINDRGHDILVSASAGSGKTTVLNNIVNVFSNQGVKVIVVPKKLVNIVVK